MKLLSQAILFATLSSLSGRLKLNQLPPCTGQGPGSFTYYAVVDATGTSHTQCAKLGDGVYVNESSTPSSFVITMASLAYTYGEVPGGTADGVNKTFTVLHPPITGSLLLYVNGQPIDPATFTVSLQTITLTAAPPANSTMMVVYRYS